MKSTNKEKDRIIPVTAVEDTEEDSIINISLRPKNLKEFIGQCKIVENLSIAITAAKQRKEPLEHILFSGPPGLGKTSLAHIIANEMDAKITVTSGPAIERAGDLIGILTNLEEGDVLFIDEIHRLSKVVEEFLYPAMETFQIDFVIDKGPYAKTIKFNLKKFTLIGATTRAGLLSSPLRGRFGIFHHLNFYDTEDLIHVVRRSARILGIELDDDSSQIIASRSRGTPRVANRLLRRVRDWAQVKSDGKITQETAVRALSLCGIDSLGLDELDRRVLKIMLQSYGGGPVGLESLAASLSEEPDTVVDIVEPYLLSIGFLKRTPRGRKVTTLARRYFNETAESQKEFF